MTTAGRFRGKVAKVTAETNNADFFKKRFHLLLSETSPQVSVEDKNTTSSLNVPGIIWAVMK